MICQDCGGEVNVETRVGLKTGCGGCGGGRFEAAYPCKACGRLHWEDGKAVFNRGGNKPFLEEGMVVIKDKKTGETLFRL